MRRDSFVRCYLEAWAYWVGFNLLGALTGYLTDGLLGLPTMPFSDLDLFFSPGALIAQGLFIIPIFAGILVGSRRPTDSTE